MTVWVSDYYLVLIDNLFLPIIRTYIWLTLQTDITATNKTVTIVLDIESLAQSSDRGSGSPKVTVSSKSPILKSSLLNLHEL